MTMPRLLAALMILASVPALAQGVSRKVHGTLRFEDTETGLLDPIRYVAVTVTPKIAPILAKTVLTDSSGSYSVHLPSAILIPGTVVEISFRARNAAVEVYTDVDGPDQWLVWRVWRIVPAGEGPISISKAVSVAQFSGQFDLAECVRVGLHYATLRRDDGDDLGICVAEYPSGGSWTTAGDDEVIRVPWGHTHDVDVAEAHGSVVLARIGAQANSVWDSYEESERHLGWDMGFAGWFAEAVTRSDPLLEPWTLGLENPPPFPAGTRWQPGRILWDILDPANEAHDRFAGNFALTRRIFAIADREFDRGETLSGIPIDRDIAGFHAAWIERDPATHADLDRLFHAVGLEPHPREDYFAFQVEPGKAAPERNEPLPISIRFGRVWNVYGPSPVRFRVELHRTAPSPGAYVLREYEVSMGQALLGTFHVSIPVPEQPAGGTWRIRLVVDVGDRFPEASEANNSVLSAGTVTLTDLFETLPFGSSTGRPELPPPPPK